MSLPMVCRRSARELTTAQLGSGTLQRASRRMPTARRGDDFLGQRFEKQLGRSAS